MIRRGQPLTFHCAVWCTATAVLGLVACRLTDHDGLPLITNRTHYAPIASDDGQTIAYLKRETVYGRGPGGGFVFGGNPEMHFARDNLFLCTATRELRDEQCQREWPLPLAKTDLTAGGRIRAKLAFRDGALLYSICLYDFSSLPTDARCLEPGGRTGSLLTNLAEGDTLPTSNDILPRWRVHLDRDPSSVEVPITNTVIVEPLEKP